MLDTHAVFRFPEPMGAGAFYYAPVYGAKCDRRFAVPETLSAQITLKT